VSGHVPRVVRLGFGRATIQREVDEELAFHLQMRTEQLVAAGLSADDARREALRQFGNLPGVRQLCVTMDQERVRVMKRANLFDDLRQDLGYAARMLRRNVGRTAVIVLTLALGIGANTAIFTLVNAVLLRKLPVRAPDELVVLGNPSRIGSMSFSTGPRADLFSYKGYKEVRDRNKLASGILASGRVDRLEVRLDAKSGEPGRPRGRFVSGNYFNVLGVPAMLGRTFDGSEDRTMGSSPVVTVSYSYWTRRLASDSSAIGRDILVNNAKFTIIGVTPPWFTGEIVGGVTDMWIPISMQAVLSPNRMLLDDTNAYWLLLLARRAPGVTFEQAQGGFTTLVRRILTEQAANVTIANGIKDLPVEVSPGDKGFSRVRVSYKAPLITLMVGVALLLLIICANVANLLLARAVARTKEMSVRLAIGAGRWRLIRQLLTESALLALLGAGLGLYLARWGSRFLLLLAADGASVIPIDTRLDIAVLAFTMLLCIVAVGVFGLVPAMRASSVDLASSMRASTKSVAGGALGARNQRIPLGKMLIAAQVALSLVLLIGAALLTRSLLSVQHVATGLDRDHLLIVDVDANSRGYTGDRLVALTRDLSERFQRLNGVAAVSFSENGIFSGTESATNLGVPGFTARVAADSEASYDYAGPGYVKATGAQLLRGRDFLASDDAASAPVVMVNETFARFYFAAENPVGRNIRMGDSTNAQIIGVVADLKDHDLVAAPVRRFYGSYIQHPFGDAGTLRFIVRASGDPASLVTPVRKAIVAHDPQLPIRGIDPLAITMRQSIREERLLTRLAAGFGTVALLLAAIGLYGVMTYAITRRTSEIGLRAALGAQRGTVVQMVLGDALRLVLVGTAIGVPLALVATKLLKTQLHGIKPADPVSIAISLLVLGASGVFAALLPALRASRVAPIEALREE
jgi:putative ABC transport system permease protein